MTVATLATLAISIYLHAQKQIPLPQTHPWVHDGPMDNIIWTRSYREYWDAVAPTTLGLLARYSDIIGIGQVSQRTNDHFTVTVDHALVGCTNGAVLVVYDRYEINGEYTPYENWLQYYCPNYFPTNQSRIIFAVSTNVYDFGFTRMFWSHAEIPLEPKYVLNNISLSYLNRSWWYVDRDDGLLLTQFTNVLQAVRFDRNWTNYFYLCRDGANSPSDRVREDSFEDLCSLCFDSTDEQKQLILDDPLVDQKHKDRLNAWLLIKPTLPDAP